MGLFRTEFVFLSSDKAPTVEQQTDIYFQGVRTLPGRRSSCARSTPAPTSQLAADLGRRTLPSVDAACACRPNARTCSMPNSRPCRMR